MISELILPILLPFATAAVCLLLWRKPKIQQIVSLMGSASHLAACVLVLNKVMETGIQVIFVGNWPAPFGISLVADHLSALMLMITGILSMAAAVYARGELSDLLRRRRISPSVPYACRRSKRCIFDRGFVQSLCLV